MKEGVQFVVVDDDEVNNMVCKIIIKTTVDDVDVKDFNIPEKGLDYIRSEPISPEGRIPIILFLDINMPSMSGWDFLDHFNTLPADVKNKFLIYMLSSSIDNRDKERAHGNKNVVGFFSKPLTRENILHVIDTQF